MTHAWLSHTLNCICFAEKTANAVILPHSGTGALHVPSLRQMAEWKPRSSKPGSQRKVMRAPEWWNKPCVDPWVGTGGLRHPTTELKAKTCYSWTCCLLSLYHYLTPDPDHKIKNVEVIFANISKTPPCWKRPHKQTFNPFITFGSDR